MKSAPAPRIAVPTDDAELVRRALARDDTAFRIIMERNNRRLYRIARGILRNDAEAEDVVQEAYVNAFTHLDGFRGDSSLTTWLARITMNEALGRLRRERLAVDLDTFEAQRTEAQIIQFPQTVTSDDPERTMAQREILQLVERATDNLPEIFRIVFITRVIEGMSVEETADLLGLRPETVKTRLHRARRLVREQLNKQIGPVLMDAFPFAGRRCERMTNAVMQRLGFSALIPGNLFVRQSSNWRQHINKSPCCSGVRSEESVSMSSNVHALERVRTLRTEVDRPDRADVEAAFRTIIRWTGDDPERDGLIETPARVARAFEEFFVGYAQDPVEILQKTFEEIEGYDEMIVLRGIRFESHCEHHLAPIIGQAWVGYVPSGRVVGISKLARVVEVYAKRLQIQEKMTAQIANTINDVLKPQGVGVIIKASHHCMTTRGVHKPDSDLVTSRMLGCFRENPLTRQEFLSMAV